MLTAGAAAASVGLAGPGHIARRRGRPNVVIFTFDDCDAGSLGCFGSPLKGVTPNFDKLASEGLRFTHAFTTTPTCQPSRLSLMTGNDTSTNKTWGHDDELALDAQTLPQVLREHGYFTAIIGKQPDYQPQEAFKWSLSRDSHGNYLTPDTWDRQNDGYQSMWRSPEGFYRGVRKLVREARDAPFFLSLNTSDPHRPWPGSVDEPLMASLLDGIAPSFLPLRPYEKNYSPLEVPVPGYLPDLPGVRVDRAQYSSALHNGDKALGRIIDALKEMGVYDNTIFIALSDQGASFPMSKQSLYPHGLNLGLVVRWPGLSRGKVSSEMLSVADIMPTVTELLGLRTSRPMDGRSFARLLRGESQTGRPRLFTQYSNAKPGAQVFPMRGIQTAGHLYIFNGWHNEVMIIEGKEHKIIYDGRTDPLIGLAWRAMKDAAATNEKLRKRVDFVRLRAPHELYDLKKDPFCLKNLADSASHAATFAEMKYIMAREMEMRSDPLLPKFHGTGRLPAEWSSL
jgi:N-sulfoglucosamine sulfohydrolase